MHIDEFAEEAPAKGRCGTSPASPGAARQKQTMARSRSLGDPELKINAGKPILSSLPEVSQHLLQPDDLFVVVACDGVWDVLTDQQAVDIVLRNWGDPAAAASTVVRTALSSGSGDNVTAQVVMFSWKAQLGAAMAKKRDGERAAEEAEARKPKPKVEVDEGDVDMFG